MGIYWSKSQEKRELFTNLPPEITREILQRLSIRSIIKRVCKLWYNKIKEGEGGELYSRKPCLAFVPQRSDMCMVYDETFKPLLKFELPSSHKMFFLFCVGRVIIDSVDGLLLVWHYCNHNLVICNPMTCECATLPLPLSSRFVPIFGFGMSKISGQYKILCGILGSRSWYVYSIGRGKGKRKGDGEGGGLWKCIKGAPGHPVCTPKGAIALFFNGNLHWLSHDLEYNNLFVSCLDLESELYTSFSLPSHKSSRCTLRILDNQLYMCGISNDLHVIWRMNKYGDANSWTKEYTFAESNIYEVVIPINILANGDLLFVSGHENQLLIYSKKTKTVVAYDSYELYNGYFINTVFYTPSFLLLASMGIHNVESLKDKTFPMYSKDQLVLESWSIWEQRRLF